MKLLIAEIFGAEACKFTNNDSFIFLQYISSSQTSWSALQSI